MLGTTVDSILLFSKENATIHNMRTHTATHVVPFARKAALNTIVAHKHHYKYSGITM